MNLNEELDQIRTISDLSLESVEGKLLIAALSKITTESQRDKEPDTVLAQVKDLALKMEFI
jgi:hypothetical protein